MVTGDDNLGRISVIANIERHIGCFDIVHVKDANGNSHPASHHFCYWQRQQTMDFPSLWKGYWGKQSSG